MAGKVKLTNWLRGQFLIEREEGPPVRMSLRHMNVGRKQVEIARFDCSKVRAEQLETFVETLANEIELKATDDAEGMGGRQRYAVSCYFKNADGPLTRYILVVDAGSDEETEDSGEFLTEPPNQKGLTSQLMRHLEAVQRTSVQITNHNATLQQRTIDRQAEQIEKMLHERFENMRVMETVLSEQHKRKMDEMEQISNQKFREELAQKASLLLPVVANRIAGKTIVPAGSPRDNLLLSLKDSLTQEQVQSLMNVLKPEQSMAVLELLQSVTPPTEEEKKADDSPKDNKNGVQPS